MAAYVKMGLFKITQACILLCFSYANGEEAVYSKTRAPSAPLAPVRSTADACKMVKNGTSKVEVVSREHQKNQSEFWCLVRTLAKSLDVLWLTMQAGESDISFWTFEWDQHGKCTGWSVYDYFRTTVELARDLNVVDALQKEGITPGHGATYDTVLIEFAFGGKAVARCGQHKITGQWQLKE